MSCIVNYVDWWMDTLSDAFRYEENPLMRLFPDHWDPRRQYAQPVTSAQCRVVIQHISEDRTYDKLKFAALVAGGVAASLCVVIAAVVAAYIAFQLTAVFFTAIAIGIEQLMGEYLVTYIVLGSALGASAAIEAAHLVCCTSIALGCLWSKEILPNMSRGLQVFSGQSQEMRRLEVQAAG